jgi:hypothetical protein
MDYNVLATYISDNTSVQLENIVEVVVLKRSAPNGIPFLNEDKLRMVFPNPCGNRITIIVKEKGDAALINSFGQVIKQWPLFNGANDLFTANLLPGVYFIKFYDESLKFIKK